MRRLSTVLLLCAGVVLVALVMAWLALRRPDISYAALEAKYASAASRYIDLPGGLHVHYRDQGPPNGPVVVMVHGFSASLQAWEPWIARLGNSYRILTLDLPGHGLTRAPAGYAASIDGYADLVDRLARRLALGPYVVVGNSMGGGVAWDDALRHPADVRALVLVDAAGWPSATAARGEPLIFKLMRNPLARSLLKEIDTRALAKQGLEAAYLDRSLVTPALVDRYVDLARAPGHRDILLSIESAPDAAVTPATFARIGVPTLILHGEDDKLIPVADSRGFAGAIPNARLIIYPGVGHVPMEQIPDRSAADLAAFLASLPAEIPPRQPADAAASTAR